MALKYHFVEILDNNYVWILEDDNKNAVVFDPGTFKELDVFVKEHGLTVKQIIITHTHYDHIGGLEEAHKAYNASVYVPNDPLCEYNNDYIKVKDGDVIDILGFKTDVYVSAYHKDPHAFYHIKEQKYAFMGDLLFPYGVGRRFGTDVKDLISTIEVVMANFDDDTLLFASHEYIRQNVEFIIKYGFADKEAEEKLALIRDGKLRHSIPFTLGSQKNSNPYFHYNNEEYLKKIDAKDSEEYLTQLRLKRDVF